MLKNTHFAFFTALLYILVACDLYIRSKRHITNYVPRLLTNDSFVSHDFPKSYAYRYTNPITGAQGQEMYFDDEESLRQIRKINSIAPVNPDDYIHRVPQVVTYTSQNHWTQTESHLPTLLNQFEDVVVYSMDLRPETIANATSKYGSRVIFISFNTTNYPPHVSNRKVYAFKGVIWADAIVRFGWCLFFDASIFLKGDVISGLRKSVFLQKNKNDNVCFKYVIASTDHSIFVATRENLYDFFPVNNEEFEKLQRFKDVKQQQSGGFSVLPTQQCLENFIKPVLMCSLYKDCIDLAGATLTGKTRHRYDQSIAHLLVGNMYGFQNSQKLIRTNERIENTKEYIIPREDAAAIVCRATDGCNTEEKMMNCGEFNGTIHRSILAQYCK